MGKEESFKFDSSILLGQLEFSDKYIILPTHLLCYVLN